MTIDIEIPPELIAKTAQQVVATLFNSGHFSESRGAGYKLIQTSATEHIGSPEFMQLVRDELKAVTDSMLGPIAREVVAAELRKLLKKIAAEEQAAGTLFPKNSETK